MYQYKIAEARMAKGWSQQDLANAVGISQPAIQRYETGARDIKSSMLIKLSSALGVTISYLVGLSDEPLETDVNPNEDIPDNVMKLKEIRESRGWLTPELFARSINMPADLYCNYEKGAYELSLSVAVKFCKALDCTLDELAGFESQGKPYTGRPLDELQIVNQYKVSSSNCRDCILRVVTEMAKH